MCPLTGPRLRVLTWPCVASRSAAGLDRDHIEPMTITLTITDLTSPLATAYLCPGVTWFWFLSDENKNQEEKEKKQVVQKILTPADRNYDFGLKEIPASIYLIWLNWSHDESSETWFRALGKDTVLHVFCLCLCLMNFAHAIAAGLFERTWWSIVFWCSFP